MMKCSICNKEIPVTQGGWSEGNNAQPVADGRCCDECNMTHVIPARMQEAIRQRRKAEEKKGENNA